MRLVGHPLRHRRNPRGQALVEFALVIPVFLALVVAIAEFAFLLTVKTGIAYASQDATQIAAELGNTSDADVYILQQIEEDVQAPVDKAKIQSVSVFWTDLNSTNKGANTFTLTLPGDSGAAYEIVNASSYSITYPRQFIARKGQLVFKSSGKVLAVDGLSSSDVAVYRMGARSRNV